MEMSAVLWAHMTREKDNSTFFLYQLTVEKQDHSKHNCHDDFQ